jgi:hypothetical protein
MLGATNRRLASAQAREREARQEVDRAAARQLLSSLGLAGAAPPADGTGAEPQ